MSNIDVADLALESGALLASVNHPALSAVLAGGKLTRGIVRQLYPNADDRMAEFIANEVHEAVFSRLPEIEQRMRDLEEKLGDKPSVTQVAIVYKGFVHNFGKADGKKRALLLNALVNAFDPELYEQSMTGRLFTLMDDLDYPDLSYLMKIDATPDKQDSPWTDPKSMHGYHATRLANVGLMARQQLTPNIPEKDLAHVAGPGAMMVKLIRDPKHD